MSGALQGKIRADVVHEKLLALGYLGSERTTRRAVAAVRTQYRIGRTRPCISFVALLRPGSRVVLLRILCKSQPERPWREDITGGCWAQGVLERSATLADCQAWRTV